MRRIFQTVQWKFVIIYISLILIAMQIIGIYFVRALEQSFVDNFTESLLYQADSLAFNVEPYLKTERRKAQEESKDLNKLVNNFLTMDSAGVQVIDQNGVIISASETEKHLIGQKNVQLEVNRALLGFQATDIRTDTPSRQRVMVLALPVRNEKNEIVGAVYVRASMKDMYDTIRRIIGIFATGTVFALLLTAALGVLLSRTITNPVKAITEQATAMANGDFNRRVEVMSNDEIGQLGQAFNYLTTRLKEALSETEEERAKLASVLANMSDGVIAADWRGKIEVYNERAQHLLKQDIKAGEHLLDVLPDFSPRLTWPLAGRQTVLCKLERENAISYVKITFTPYKRQHFRASGIIAVVQDITEQEKLDQQRKEFVANVSHELRTPLTTIKSYVEALDDGAVHDREVAPRFLKVVQQETERMIRLVTDLLRLSRIDSKEAHFKRRPTPLNGLLEEAVTRFQMACDKKGIALHLDAPRHLPSVWVDKDEIGRVLDNLLSNAVKYTPDGGTVRVSAAKKMPTFVEVKIQDSGIGIPKKDLSRIFERFYRIDKARSRSMGGTGLGLSIAQEIVHAHGGQIDIESDVNEGTTVRFTLPVGEQGESL